MAIALNDLANGDTNVLTDIAGVRLLRLAPAAIEYVNRRAYASAVAVTRARNTRQRIKRIFGV
jgi:hypothetical protein